MPDCAESPELIDADADGRLDLIYTCLEQGITNTRGVGVAYQDAEGRLSNEIMAVTQLPVEQLGFRVGDIDGDGLKDIVLQIGEKNEEGAQTSSTERLEVFRQIDRHFELLVSVPIESDERLVALLAVDGDEKIEVAVTNGSIARILRWQDDRLTERGQVRIDNGRPAEIQRIRTIEVDGAPPLELVTDRRGDSLQVHRFLDGDYVAVDSWGTVTYPLADVDGDGLTDHLEWRPQDQRWRLRVATVLFPSDDTRHSLFSFISLPYKGTARTGDFDGDGKADIAIFSDEKRLTIIESENDGSLSARYFQAEAGLSWGTVLDADGDGADDLINMQFDDETHRVTVRMLPSACLQ